MTDNRNIPEPHFLMNSDQAFVAAVVLLGRFDLQVNQRMTIDSQIPIRPSGIDDPSPAMPRQRIQPRVAASRDGRGRFRSNRRPIAPRSMEIAVRLALPTKAARLPG